MAATIEIFRIPIGGSLKKRNSHFPAYTFILVSSCIFFEIRTEFHIWNSRNFMFYSTFFVEKTQFGIFCPRHKDITLSHRISMAKLSQSRYFNMKKCCVKTEIFTPLKPKFCAESENQLYFCQKPIFDLATAKT